MLATTKYNALACILEIPYFSFYVSYVWLITEQEV
jgi:hypothetical protein